MRVFEITGKSQAQISNWIHEDKPTMKSTTFTICPACQRKVGHLLGERFGAGGKVLAPHYDTSGDKCRGGCKTLAEIKQEASK